MDGLTKYENDLENFKIHQKKKHFLAPFKQSSKIINLFTYLRSRTIMKQ